MRVYVSEITYAPDGSPTHIILSPAEQKREIRIAVTEVSRAKRMSWNRETLICLQVEGGHTMLLLIDHNRSNHYSLCRRETYRYLMSREIEDAVPSDPLAKHSVSSHVPSYVPAMPDYRDFRILIDSYILSYNPGIIETLIHHNSLYLSPNYESRLETYLTEPGDRMHILQLIEHLKRLYPDRLHCGIQIHPGAVQSEDDPVNEFQYMLQLADQLSTKDRKVIILTKNFVLQRILLSNGFHAFNPMDCAAASQEPASEPLPTLVASPLRTSTELGLPPRSSRQRKAVFLPKISFF